MNYVELLLHITRILKEGKSGNQSGIDRVIVFRCFFVHINPYRIFGRPWASRNESILASLELHCLYGIMGLDASKLDFAA